MIRIGLTGSIGSGKSLVAEVFSGLGADIFHADNESKKFLADNETKKEIIGRIPGDYLDQDGNIVPGKLANIVFKDPVSLASLNEIIHPRVRRAFKEWQASKSDKAYVICEAAILFESGFYKEFDQIIAVSAPEELRIQRVMKRDGVTRNEVMSRIKNQWDEQEVINHSHFVIINDGNHLLIPQVIKIHESILNKSTLAQNSPQ